MDSYESLLSADCESVVQRLRERSCFVSPAQIGLWKRHAASYAAGSPVLFGDPLNLGGRFLALDLEYVVDGIIWLIGFCLVDAGRREYSAALGGNGGAGERGTSSASAKSWPRTPCYKW